MPIRPRLAPPIVFALVALAPPAWAESPVEKILAEAAESCSGIDGGTMTAPEGTVTEVELGGGVTAAIVDEGALQCSSAASAYCGSGGCMLHAVVGDKVTTWQATGWRLIDWNQDKILLIGRDGGWCGGSGAERCYEAVVWSDGRFLTVAPPQDSESE
jgi:hypothetical protein